MRTAYTHAYKQALSARLHACPNTRGILLSCLCKCLCTFLPLLPTVRGLPKSGASPTLVPAHTPTRMPASMPTHTSTYTSTHMPGTCLHMCARLPATCMRAGGHRAREAGPGWGMAAHTSMCTPIRCPCTCPCTHVHTHISTTPRTSAPRAPGRTAGAQCKSKRRCFINLRIYRHSYRRVGSHV